MHANPWNIVRTTDQVDANAYTFTFSPVLRGLGRVFGHSKGFPVDGLSPYRTCATTP